MEKFIAQKSEQVTTGYSPEVAKLLEGVATNFEELPLAEQVSVLLDRIKTYGATVGDTSEPVDNSVRHEAETLAKVLNDLEVESNKENYLVV